jgi:hypothetical protein
MWRWKMRIPLLARVLLVFVLLIIGSSVGATTMLPLSMDDLIGLSDIVAHVRVGEVRFERSPDAPFRVTELRVLESFQGVRQGETLELWQRGDDNTIVVGDPVLQTGQQGVAFLRQNGDRVYLTAMGQSFWWIEGEGTSIVARRDLDGITIVNRSETRLTPPNLLSWDSLRRLILRVRLEVSP